MMLVNGQTPLCCFVARLQSHTFVIFNSFHMQSTTRQVRLDSLTYCNARGQQQLPDEKSNCEEFNHLIPDVELTRTLTHTHRALHNVSPLYISYHEYIAIPYSPYNRLLILQLASIHLNTAVIPLSTRILARAITISVSLHYFKLLFTALPLV